MTLCPALVVEADGGSRGNPGVAGYGALVRDARTGRVLAERAAPLGKASNNVAEYTGLLEGLRAVLDLGLAKDAAVEVKMDSKLVVEQMSGRWKIKHEDMRRLALDARRLIDQIQAQGGAVEFTWIPRDRNKDADTLSNDGMDGVTVVRDHVEPAGSDATSSAGPAGRAAPDARGAGEAEASLFDELGGFPTEQETLEQVEDAVVSNETVPTLEGRTRLVLVRHGVSDFTVSGRMDGRGGSNPPLNQTGRAQARRAAAAVRALLDRSEDAPVTVVSSSLRRAQMTGDAVAAALGVQREEDADWDEQGFGDWDGLTMAELVADRADQLRALRDDATFAPPDGESRAEVDERVARALERAVARGGTVVVAAHRIVIMSVLCRLLGMEPRHGWSVATAPASLTAVEIWPDGGVQVAFVNDTHHLDDPALDPQDSRNQASVRIFDTSAD